MTGPHPMSCRICGERFHRAGDSLAHICAPNWTGLEPGADVRVGGFEGVVLRVARKDVQVYFRSSYRSQWYSASDCERIP